MQRLLVALIFCASLSADSLDDLARDFWEWRAIHQPISTDDIPRIERPAGWAPDWSKDSVVKQRESLAAFEARWKKIDSSAWTVARQVDYRLMGSALARVRWELDMTRNWQRDPQFYVDQTLASVYDRMLQPPPFDRIRSMDILQRVRAIPKILEDAKVNLDHPARPFAQLAIASLQDIRTRLTTAIHELQPLLLRSAAADLDGATEKAIGALESYRSWLEQRIDSMPAETAVGRDAYVWFLKNVALMPFTPEQLLAMGRQEWERSVAFEAYERQRNARLPELALPATQEDQIARQHAYELEIRKYLEGHGFLTFPASLQHYWNRPLPAYLAALPELGVTDDLTGPARLTDNSTSYIRLPSPKLGYFSLATARDPRVMIMHEGVHYYQLALSWAHEDAIRRHYYDSGANEGIGFYAEEMGLQAGLFDDSPRSREIIYSFMRLRALRVEADVKLALGLFSIEQAAEYLEKTVPMDRGTARWEAAFFATLPGQAITYQIGKLQIIQMLSDARGAQGGQFNLKAFHDFVWKNGNVPIALQRWEYVGIKPEGLW